MYSCVTLDIAASTYIAIKGVMHAGANLEGARGLTPVVYIYIYIYIMNHDSGS